MVFKFFGKYLSEIPQVLHSQILNWFAHNPSELFEIDFSNNNACPTHTYLSCSNPG
jgi:hypothetical protein